MGGALTAEGCVLVAADGHDGADAAECSADTALAMLSQSPSARDDLPAVLTAAGRAAWEATRAHPYPRRGSRAALALSVVRGTTVHWATVGDVSVLAGPAVDLRRLNQLRHVYLGGPLEADHIQAVSDQGSFELGPAHWLLLATDGLLDFADPGDIRSALAVATGPEQATQALLQLAGAGGAGDNVGVALLGPP